MLKKYLTFITVILCTSSLYAAEDQVPRDGCSESLGSSSSSSSSSSEKKINLEGIMDGFRANPENYELKGGLIGGFLSESAPKEEAVAFHISSLVDNINDLREHIKTLQGAASNVEAIKRALQETQEKLDAEKRLRQQKEAELIAAEQTTRLLTQKREELLTGLSNAELLATVEKQRKEDVEAKNRSLTIILSQIEQKVQEMEELQQKTTDLEESMKLPQEGSTEEIEKRAVSISLIIDQHKQKLENLRQEKEALEKAQINTKEQIKELQKKIKENDYYQQIYDMTLDRNVADEDLTFRIVCICTFLKTDLDKLSEGRRRLIEVMYEYSLPRTPKPKTMPESLPEGNIFLGDIERRFRFIANDFGKTLGWYGTPINFAEIKHAGSPFEANQKAVEEQAKKFIQSVNTKQL